MVKKQISVRTPDGLRCPAENCSGWITDTATDVPDNRYYRRLIADGSLIVVTPKPVKPAKKKELANDDSK